MKLYELVESYNQIKDLELTQDEIQALLDNVGGTIEEKVENIVKLIKSIEGENEAIKAEQDRINKLKASNTSKIDSLKRYIDSSMQLLGKDKLNAGLFKISYRKSSSVVITDESLIPDDFMVIIPESKKVDKVGLKKYMKEHDVEGAFIEENHNLQIK